MYCLKIYVSTGKNSRTFYIKYYFRYLRNGKIIYVYIHILCERQQILFFLLSWLVCALQQKQYFFICFSLIYIPLEFPPSHLIPTLPPSFCLPKIQSFPISFQKSAGLSGILTEHGLRSYKKTRYMPSYKGWMK